MFEPVLLANTHHPQSRHLATYRDRGGYQGLERALEEYPPERLIQLVKDANLRGRGGAGFSAGQKWGFIPTDSRLAKFLCCNADEGEPGTFKDREIIEKDPHQLIEGMAIAAYAIGASRAYIYIRGEFVRGAHLLEIALGEANQAGYLGRNILGSGFDLEIHVHRGAGAYICGEETALIESLEGFRGQPRYKPPFPAMRGFYGYPTVVNNVETLACLPHIVRHGAKWFRGIGPEASPGPKLFCISGHVRRPGLYELPMGTMLRDLVEGHACGPESGRRIKAVIPGGISAPMFPEADIDIAMDFDSLAAAGSMLGSGGVIVMDDTTCMVKATRRMMAFFHHESCGKCTPCREGLHWVVKILGRIEEGNGRADDLEELERLADNIFGNTFCPLGDGAVMALRGAYRHFRDEFAYHVAHGRCDIGATR